MKARCILQHMIVVRRSRPNSTVLFMAESLEQNVSVDHIKSSDHRSIVERSCKQLRRWLHTIGRRTVSRIYIKSFEDTLFLIPKMLPIAIQMYRQYAAEYPRCCVARCMRSFKCLHPWSQHARFTSYAIVGRWIISGWWWMFPLIACEEIRLRRC